ncbi:SH3 domain-containing protein [Roseibium sp. FZY0029]|uniref:SH3 domain-containing protein n=1 Tax=Roseibium sp. FZY0029 TaxID=3116647 RepID=UPI002EC161E2|nr:SH3 domain-containing protein [Roseibium sp. FZY0029]
MYSVTAPATACDFPEGHDPDNAPQKNELKLVVPNDPLTSDDTADIAPDSHATVEDTDLDGTTLAAKILQMHATSADLKTTASRRPTLSGAQEETGFDMPGVLRTPLRGTRTAGLQPEPVPAPAKMAKAADSFRQGPSFGTLLLSTLLIVGIGSGAVFFSLSGLLAGKTSDSRTVQTEQINAATTIESLIAGAETEFEGRTDLTAAPTASAEQVKLAKDRIRQVFASRSTASPAPEDHSNPLGHDATNAADPKIQARLVPPQPVPVKIAPPVTPAGSALVSGAVAAPSEAGSSPVSDTQVPDVDASAAKAPAPTAAPAATDANTSDEAFPLAGKIRSSVNLREAQNKDAAVLAVIPAGTEVRYSACGNWWCGVQFDGKTGYVGESFLEALTKP